MELTKEYFDKHYQELDEFLSGQFEKVFARFDEMAATAELAALERKTTEGFAEQSIELGFIQADIAVLRKDLEALAKRTKDDDNAFTQELVKLKSRIDALECKVRALKKQHA